VTEPTPETHCGSCSQHQQVGALSAELANIHRVHIDDVRALVLQFETEQAEWADELKKARASECGALCKDVENDRDAMAEENRQLRDQGVPGVMHETDRARYQAMVADRDRFAGLHRNLGERQRRLIGEYRGARYAVRLVGEIEALLSVALDKPGAVNRDNLVESLGELVKERDHHRESAWARVSDTEEHNDQRQSMQYTIDTQRSTIDTQLEDLIIQKRITESQAREVEELTGRNTVLIQRALAAEGEVRRMAADAIREETRRDREINEAITVRDRALADWSGRYNGLESASQAVGQQLTLALRHCDRMREQRGADTRLLRIAFSTITEAGLHEGGWQNRPDWLERTREWVAAFHVREDALHTPSPGVDPLDRFAVRAFSNGARDLVQLTHRGCDPRAYPEAPGGIQMTALIRDAHWHLAQYHAEQPDEVSPGDETLPCDSTAHSGEAVCCGNMEKAPTEVNE
jgi:hypothetical protein